MRDGFDLPLTTSSERARDLYVTAVEKFLGAEMGVEAAFEAAIQADDGLALACIGLARQAQIMGDRAAIKPLLARAESLMGGLNARERGHIHFHLLMMRGKAQEALTFARDEYLPEFPRDAMVASACAGVFGLIGFSGRPARDVENLAFMTALAPAAGQDWWFQAQHGFAQLELGWFAPAERLLDQSLAARPWNAHVAHIKSHLFYEMGERAEGLAFLRDWHKAQGDGGTMACHLTWHRALWALEERREAEVWQLFDNGIRPGVRNTPPLNLFTDATALLFRAELVGLKVPGDKWQAVSDFAQEWFPRPGVIFADMHSALAHALAGQAERLEIVLAGSKGPCGDLVRGLGQAFRAMSVGDWPLAAEMLGPVSLDHVRLGGSNAQRDLVDFAYAACLIRSGGTAEARRLLELRRPQAILSDVIAGA